MNPALVTLTGDAELLGRRHAKKKARRHKGKIASRVEAIQTQSQSAPSGLFPDAAPAEDITAPQAPEEAETEETSDDSGEETSGEEVYGNLPYQSDDIMLGTEVVPVSQAKTNLPAKQMPFSAVEWAKKNPILLIAAGAAVYFLFFHKKGRR